MLENGFTFNIFLALLISLARLDHKYVKKFCSRSRKRVFVGGPDPDIPRFRGESILKPGLTTGEKGTVKVSIVGPIKKSLELESENIQFQKFLEIVSTKINRT